MNGTDAVRATSLTGMMDHDEYVSDSENGASDGGGCSTSNGGRMGGEAPRETAGQLSAEATTHGGGGGWELAGVRDSLLGERAVQGGDNKQLGHASSQGTPMLMPLREAADGCGSGEQQARVATAVSRQGVHADGKRKQPAWRAAAQARDAAPPARAYRCSTCLKPKRLECTCPKPKRRKVTQHGHGANPKTCQGVVRGAEGLGAGAPTALGVGVGVGVGAVRSATFAREGASRDLAQGVAAVTSAADAVTHSLPPCPPQADERDEEDTEEKEEREDTYKGTYEGTYKSTYKEDKKDRVDKDDANDEEEETFPEIHSFSDEESRAEFVRRLSHQVEITRDALRRARVPQAQKAKGAARSGLVRGVRASLAKGGRDPRAALGTVTKGSGVCGDGVWGEGWKRWG